MTTRLVLASALAAIAGGAASYAGAPLVEAIYTEIPGHPTATVPGGPVGSEFTAIRGIRPSPSGEHWIMSAFAVPLASQFDIIVVGSGTAGTEVAREGNATSIAGATYGFMDTDCGINDSGRYAFGNRLTGATTATDEIIFLYNGTSIVPGVREGDSAPGLVDPSGAGNELQGNALNSAQVLADGSVAFYSDLITNIATTHRTAIYANALPSLQSGLTVDMTTIAGISSASASVAVKFSPSGEDYIARIDSNPSAAATDDAIIVSNDVVLKKGDPVPPLGSTVDQVFGLEMASNGDWTARGDVPGDNDWAMLNGAFIAWTGKSVEGGAELWGPVLSGLRSDAAGNVLIAGETNAADANANAVLVLNDVVIVREGQEVDVDSNGMLDDNAVVSGFRPDMAWLAPDGYVYFGATMRDKGGASLGDAFLRISVATKEPCPADLDGDGVVGSSDLASLLGSWGAGGPADFDGGGVGASDLATLLGSWGPC